RKRIGSIFMLSIAYASSIGGVATLIGTPPNAIFVSLAKSLLDRDIGFAEWMVVGMPLSLISLAITWLYMSRYIKSKMSILDDIEIINKRLRELGPMNTNEKIVFYLFIGVVVAWITRSILWSKYIPMIDDSVIALLAAIILFAIPSKKRIIDWSISSSIPWGVLLLIGGGLTLASSFTITGLDKWITSKLLFMIPSSILLVPIITTFTIFMGEIMSNTAMAALLIPIGANISTSFGVDAIVIMFIIALASSYSFMLPMSTPPNSIIFGSGYVTVREMTRIGFMINIFGIIIITLIGTFLIPIIVS
ncbi:MAG: DASS family sodium-coupled anion symporter, partial [Candidatus Nitrosocaldaceae archaeon]